MEHSGFLTEVASDIIQFYWGLDLHIPVYIDGRLKKTLGTYEFKMEDDAIIPLRIILSKELVSHGSKKFISFVLKHELCHFVLSQLKLPFCDGDEYFENELKRIRAFSTKKIYILFRLRCDDCERIFSYRTKSASSFTRKNQKCPHCGGNYMRHDVYYVKRNTKSS